MPIPARRIRHLSWLFAVLAGLGVAGCGGGGSAGTPAPPAATPPPAPAPSGPLTGASTSSAKAAIQTVDVGDTYTEAEVSVGSTGQRIIRAKLEIVFYPDATVGQVNTLLTDLKAQITTSLRGLEGVVVRIPDPGTLDALSAIVSRIENEPFVWFASRAVLPATLALPENIGPNATDGARIRHHFAIGAPGAWNAREAWQDVPRVIVVDEFGGGLPSEVDLDFTYIGVTAGDLGTLNATDHGYHVLGILAGKFGGTATDRGQVTGILPTGMRLSLIDHLLVDPKDINNRLLRRMRDVEGGTFVVNASTGYECDTEVTCFAETFVREQAAWWIMKVREFALEDRFLLVAAAGNIKAPLNATRDARFGSDFNAAALLTDLVDGQGNALAPLTNVLVIENVRPQADFPYAGPRCVSSTSFVGGNLGGIGGDVWSFTDAETTAGELSGTSMATPQVAGLAAYLLSIRPELKPQELAGILLSSSAPVPVELSSECSDWPTPARLIQPYPALLALDRPNQGTEQVPVRRALLDIDNSRAFTEADLEKFIHGWETAQGTHDWGRADLNNDGRTGGATKRPFDLDMDRAISADGTTIQIRGEPFRFDETALTDIAILCYYAYSNLYADNPEAREARDLLFEPYRQQGQCGAVSDYSVSATLQGRMFAGVAVPLWVTVSDRDGAVEGASISVTAEGGSAGGGVTDADGRMESSATIDDDAALITLTITVAVQGEVVGETVLQAQRAVPAIAAGGARVPCCSLSNITSGVGLAPPRGTFSHAVVPSRTITWTWDPGVPPGEPTSGKMHRFSATGHDVQLQVSFCSLSTSEDDPTYLSLAVETTGPAPRNTYFLFNCPIGTPWDTGSRNGDCVYVAGNSEYLILGEPVPPPGNPGTVELLRDRAYTLALYTGSIAGDSFNVDLLFSRDAEAP